MVNFQFNFQPKNLGSDIKTFLLYLRGDDKTKTKSIAKSITIKTKNRRTKFKLRCPKYLYTLKIDDEKKANKIKSSIPQGKFFLIILYI